MKQVSVVEEKLYTSSLNIPYVQKPALERGGGVGSGVYGVTPPPLYTNNGYFM